MCLLIVHRRSILFFFSVVLKITAHFVRFRFLFVFKTTTFHFSERSIIRFILNKTLQCNDQINHYDHHHHDQSLR